MYECVSVCVRACACVSVRNNEVFSTIKWVNRNAALFCSPTPLKVNILGGKAASAGSIMEIFFSLCFHLRFCAALIVDDKAVSLTR